MAEPALEGSQPVDLSKHPSGIVPTLQRREMSLTSLPQRAAIQASCAGTALRSLDAKKAVAAAAVGMLAQRNVEAELFRGRHLTH